MDRVSIVIPTYNEAHHLPNLLESLNNVLPDVTDIIIVDNGSDDNTVEIAEQFGCRVVRLEHKSYPSVARNRGVSVSDSDTIIFLDADIIVTEQWAEEVKRLTQDPAFRRGDFISGDSYHMSLNPSWIEKYWFEPLRQRKKNYINGGNIVLSRKAFDKIGGFNNSLETGEDVDFSTRARSHGIEVRFNPALVVHHEGFPQDLKNFFRRERWHGKGDFASIDYFVRSRVAQVAVIIGVCYLAIVVLGAFAVAGESVAAALSIVAAVSVIVLLCVAASFARFNKQGPAYSLVGTFIYFIYFNARLASLFSVWRSR